MKRAVIHPEAEAERLAAAAYIENSRDGYGMLFLDVYEKLRDTICKNPALFPKGTTLNLVEMRLRTRRGARPAARALKAQARY